jgi:hypothetical protein
MQYRGKLASHKNKRTSKHRQKCDCPRCVGSRMYANAKRKAVADARLGLQEHYEEGES